MTDRPYMAKWANEILQIAKGDWDNPVLLNKLYGELRFRSTSLGVHVREVIGKRIEELRELERSAPAFKWPSTNAPAGINGFSGDQFWYQDGLLSYVGYRTGKTNGLRSAIRHQILDCVLFNDLPRVNSDAYMEEWGQPKTSTRLKKMAESLASFARNAKRKDSASMSYAIDDWEEDLSYLYENYYHEKLGFYWPDTDL